MEEQQTSEGEAAEELRLFPLNLTLFPGMTLPLRIFEERYKLMIGECLESDEPFGVVLIREGPEVGGPANPYNVGTTARITRFEKLELGRMNLETVGERRFRIVGTVHERPYLKGKVEYFSEDPGQMGEEVVEQARELFGEYIRGLATLRGGWIRDTDVQQDPAKLSYAIAQYLELPARARQRLLELDPAIERLQFEIPLLEGANQRLKEEQEKRSPYKGPRLN